MICPCSLPLLSSEESSNQSLAMVAFFSTLLLSALSPVRLAHHAALR